MPSIIVNVSSDVLIWVLRQIESENIDESVLNLIQQWIDGAKIPTFNQIEGISKKTRVPLGYFFLQTPPQEDIRLVDFRTVDSVELVNPSRDLIDTIADMEKVRDWMREYRISDGFDVCSVVGATKGINNPSMIAGCIRQYLEIKDNWYKETNGIEDSFSYIRHKINQIGIIVMMNGIVKNNTHRPLNVAEFRAFALLDDMAPLIFINGADTHGARLFSLFHELVHIFIGENDLFNDRQLSVSSVSATESLCNAVAGELLVPQLSFVKSWDSCDMDDIYEKTSSIAKEYHCGVLVVARRALDNKKISERKYKQIADKVIEQYQQYKSKNKENGGNFYNTLASRVDRVFVQSLCLSLSEGRVTYPEVFRLTNTNMKTFPHLAMNVGGVDNW